MNTQDEIIKSRKQAESRKKEIETQMTVANNELKQLQGRCGHPNQKSQSGYDFTAYWCDDCGKSWSTRG